MASEITPLEHIIQCIKNKDNFVLQGGAGSGKTETLKQVLGYISKHHPKKRIACITHTNLAVDEIKSRVGGDYTISTIHSFLHSLIKRYKKNIHQVIHEIYQLPKVEDLSEEDFDDDRAYKKKRYYEYKKAYEKYAKPVE